ncbi:MAG: hypothetical protein FJZ96_14200, partial [Chloroflexi bacterium]|nr:hypothetical protein [Chloroflexota bacterium]
LGILMLYAILRYFETGRHRYLYLLTASTVLHFTAKETAFIYTAQALLFLAFFFVARVTRRPWANISLYNAFIVLLALAVLLLGASAVPALSASQAAPVDPLQTMDPLDPTGTPGAALSSGFHITLASGLSLASILAFVAAGIMLIIGYGWKQVRRERSFDMLILLGTMVLPQLSAFVIQFLGWDPLDYSFNWSGWDWNAILQIGMVRTLIVFVAVIALSIAIGLWWNRNLWLKNAAVWYVPFTLLYTSFFTNGQGFFTGAVGSLGYWLAQQEVARGGQPWYFYILVQIPLYEFLPFFGFLLAVLFAIRRRSPAVPFHDDTVRPNTPIETGIEYEPSSRLVFALLLWWSVSSLAAFSIAGEKMPWLTFHITLPMILLSGWGLGQVIERMDWQRLRDQRGWLLAVLLVIFGAGTAGAIASGAGSIRPFSGKDLVHLQATATFLLSCLGGLGGLLGLAWLVGNRRFWLLFTYLAGVLGSFFGAFAIVASDTPPFSGAEPNHRLMTYLFIFAILLGFAFLAALGWELTRPALIHLARLGLALLFGFLAVLTARAAVRAAYLQPESGQEYLVYAHGASGIKDIMKQAAEISERTSGGYTDMLIAYDVSSPDTGVSWPFTWYLRDYPNLRPFDEPGKTLREAPIIIVDQKNFTKIEPVVGDAYYRFDYIRMVWPNQDYFGLTWDRVRNAIANPEIRAGIFEVWYNRDFTRYAGAVGSPYMTDATWEPTDKMRLYIRKDIAAMIWNYGSSPTEAPAADPYESGHTDLAADLVFGSSGTLPGQLQAPRGIAIAPDGSVYVADSRNHRIQRFSPSGELLTAWGTFADASRMDAPIGTFYEPWGVAVSPDGQWVYVADTWNHRIQKFTSSGGPVTMWGYDSFGQNIDPYGFWGPRGIAVDPVGNVLVVDTGNKRVIVYDANGGFITQFGTAGLGAGQFDEPVGITIDAAGIVYVVDTWNQRIQSFAPISGAAEYFPLSQWDVVGWYGQSLDNKPFIAAGRQGNIFITDPELFRVIEFSSNGTYLRSWGSLGIGDNQFALAAGVAVDSEGRVWVSDAGNNRLMRFTLPDLAATEDATEVETVIASPSPIQTEQPA